MLNLRKKNNVEFGLNIENSRFHWGKSMENMMSRQLMIGKLRN